MPHKFDINKTAGILGVNPYTLRRWDSNKIFEARRDGEKGHRYYFEDDIENFLSDNYRYLLKIAQKWALDPNPPEILRRFYCPDKSIFKARLSRFEYDLSQNNNFTEIFPLIVAITGEIGNNSFDHNLGNWPDVAGTFFGYNVDERKVILVDRGQGVLKTLRQVKPTLPDHLEALKVAFTEIISGRAPEARGNGLKYVRGVVVDYNFKLFFQSGDAVLSLSKGNKALKIEKSRDFIKGTFAVINY